MVDFLGQATCWNLSKDLDCSEQKGQLPNLLSLASDSGSEDVFCLLRTVLLPPSPADGCPVDPGVPGPPAPAKIIK